MSLPHVSSPETATGFLWLRTGSEALDAMLQGIEAAQHSIRLEKYIFRADPPGEKFRAALTAAARRGVKVRVMVDAFGSAFLPEKFWAPLVEAGGEFRFFSLPGLGRFGLRDHRKLLVCDEHLVFIGGVNIAPEYAGDGVHTGWRDLALQFHGTLAGELAVSFDTMFAMAHFRRPRFAWLRHAIRQRRLSSPHAAILLAAPGWRRNPMVRSLVQDFRQADQIRIIAAYFLPLSRILRALRHAARRGAKVQLILAARSDVWLMQLATRSLYRRLLKNGVEIYEYQPQVLHAKLIIVNEHIVYAGSANLDVRSLWLNFELIMRVENHRLTHEASEIFSGDLQHCRRIELAEWVKGSRWWHRWQENIAYFLLARLDPFLARHSWRR